MLTMQPVCHCRSVSVEKRDCGGFCQHTTCSSCLVLRRPACPQACAQTDHVCLHHFGRCVHSHLEAHRQTVCHQNLQVNTIKPHVQAIAMASCKHKINKCNVLKFPNFTQQSNNEGYFMCLAPACPNAAE